MKSRPFRSPWGIHRVRWERREIRFRFLDGPPRLSPMSLRYFNQTLDRMSQNWSR